MYKFDFLKTIHDHIHIYRDFPLPVVICSKDLRVYWSNDLARQYYAFVAETGGLRRVFAEFDADDIFKEAMKNGNCVIREIFPFSNVNMSVTPILENEEFVGAALIFIRMDNLIDSKTYYQSTHMTEAISYSIREVVSDIFKVLDLTALKSDFMNAGWVKSGLGGVADNSYRILRVAANITEFANYQSEQFDFKPEPVSLNAFLTEIGDTVVQLADSMGIPVVFAIPDEDFVVWLDSDKFEHALFNVLHNALFYTREGNRVSVKLRRNKRKQVVTITVSDKGLGIPEAALPGLTRPYYKYVHSKIHHGIGLGLTIAEYAVGLHDGSLDIQSRKGEGTTVKISLPMDNNEARGVVLAQPSDGYRLTDRFAPVYTGLADAALSPHNTAKKDREFSPNEAD